MMKRDAHRLQLANSYLSNFQVAQFNLNKLIAEERIMRKLRRRKSKVKDD